MKKIIFLLLLSTVVFTTSYSQTHLMTLLEKAEIVGVENEFYLIDGQYAGITLRNPFNFDVSVVVEMHRTAHTDKSPCLWDQIIMKKYVVLGPKEEYQIPTSIYVDGRFMTKNTICTDAPSNTYAVIYYTDIKAYKTYVFQ